MIVKSISKKGVCFGKLLAYIGAPEKAEDAYPEKGTILHNMKTSEADLGAMEQELLDNHQYVSVRRNGVACFHEILSLKDPHPNMVPILEDLGQTYLALRAPKALAYGRVHFHNDHPHLHLLISGNEIESPRKVRISKKQFATIKQKLERYQERHYPFLSHSVVFGRAKSEKTLTPAQTKVRGQILQYLDRAETNQSFVQCLEQAGMRFYQRGKSMGVEVCRTGKKYRLKTLDLHTAYQTRKAQWDKVHETAPDLLRKQQKLEKNLSRGRGG